MARVLLRRSAFTNYTVAIDSVGGNYGSLHHFPNHEAARSIEIPAALTGRSLFYGTGITPAHVNLLTTIPAAPINATYAGWMNCNNADWFRPMWYKEFGTPIPYIAFIQNATTIRVASADNLSQVTWTISALSINTWYHIAVRVTNTTTIRLYIDGISQGDEELIGGVTEINQLGSAWRGWLDDMRYYGASLPSAQIVELTAGNEATGYTPAHNWKFDEGL